MKNLIKILLLFCVVNGFAQQNLVPNHSFEVLDSCPKGLTEIVCAKYWEAYNATPDLFSPCYNGNSNDASSPKNTFGYICPSNGQNYAGFASLVNIPNSTYQEILGIKLTNTLNIGTQYFFSFKVALAGQGGNSYANTKIGLKFATKKFNYSFGTITATSSIVNNLSTFHSNSLITDTTNWTTINGSFISDSSYTYLYIGNFFSNSNTSPVLLYGNSSTAYYYLDDVCVSTNSLTCNISSQTPCFGATKIKQDLFEFEKKVFPNPTQDFIYFETPKKEFVNYEIYDFKGDLLIFDKKIPADLSRLKSGVYFLKINLINNKSITKKIIKT
jgi:hypothetical protein